MSLQSGEGVRSLARSFMQAGARSTVSSLWKVDDLATKQIMVKFYEKLAEGMGKAMLASQALAVRTSRRANGRPLY
ncbi:MAG: CHAT domain-containing protein [Flavobacteriales bacterium]|nr:CHAT domain-containing protein [Flavobacteriales bacterium]